MEVTLPTILEIIAIVGVFTGLIKYLIVTPLQTAISALNEAVKELRQLLDRMEQDHKGLDRRITIVEESMKAAHRRLDEIIK